MTTTGDLMTSMVLREFREAEGIKVIAVTSMSSLVAALAATHMGRPLAIAPGFGTLDAPAVASLTGGEWALGTAHAAVGPLSDTFVAVARGMVGVVTSPAQLDREGATNLSRVGGTDQSPKVALPGSRGLPDNNDSPSRVWYLFPAHNSRTLVERVDFRSGSPPRTGRVRRLLTPLGRFQLRPERGWSALALTPGTAIADVADNTGFEIEIETGVAEVPGPTAGEMAAFEAVDPLRLRDLEFLGRNEAAARIAEIAGEGIQPPVRD